MGIMGVVALMGLESYRGAISIKNLFGRINALANLQNDMMNDIEQMQKLLHEINEITEKEFHKISRNSSEYKNKGSTKPKTIQPKKPKVLSPKPSSSPSASRPVRVDKSLHYSDAVTEELIRTAIDRSYVEVFLQPIVRLPHRRVVMLEVFARLGVGNGQTLSASEYMKIAKEKNLQVHLDNLLLQQSLEAIKEDSKDEEDNKKPLSYMLNIEESTLKNLPFMKDLLTFLQSNRALAGRLVFEITQTSFQGMKQESLEIIKSLAQLGCGVSMDQVETPHIDREFMRDIGVRYIKIAAARLAGFSTSDEGIRMMNRIKESLSEDGVSVIADKIEDEPTLFELLDLEIDYGQGYLFGKPENKRFQKPSFKILKKSA